MIPIRLPSDKPKRGRFPVADKAKRTVDGIVFDSAKEATRYAEFERNLTMASLLRKRPPPLYVLALEAVKLGADTSGKIASLLGVSKRVAGTTLHHLWKKKGLIVRVDEYQRGRQGTPARWRAA